VTTSGAYSSRSSGIGIEAANRIAYAIKVAGIKLYVSSDFRTR